MNLRALRMFVATAELGALGHASAQLHLSQPAASRQLRALEDELGVPLFHRSGRTLQLTPEGADLLLESQQLLKAADMLSDRAEALKGGLTGTLRVAATTHVIAGVLAPLLREHMRRHPAVQVQLVEGGAAQQPERLETGEVQLAIMPAGDERFDGRLLYPVYAVAVLPLRHRLAKRSVVDIEQLASEPLLLLRREFGSRVWFERACEIARIKPQIRLESTSSHTMIELVAADYGVAVVPSTVIVRTAGLRVLPIVQNQLALGRWSMVAWDRGRLLPQYARQFVDALVVHSHTMQPGSAFTKHAPRLPRPAWPAP